MKLTFPLNEVVTFLHELYFKAYKESLNFVCFIESVFILRKCSMIFKKKKKKSTFYSFLLSYFKTDNKRKKLLM